MRWLNVRRVRNVLKKGGSRFNESRAISDIKSADFVLYLRARRASIEVNQSIFISYAKRNRGWLRKEHFKRKRMRYCPIASAQQFR